ncbi:MAG: TonB-dependent receptor [Caulobacteraceae bacterium]
MDRNDDQRYSYVTDLTIGNVPTGSKSGTPYSYFINDSLTTGPALRRVRLEAAGAADHHARRALHRLHPRLRRAGEQGRQPDHRPQRRPAHGRQVQRELQLLAAVDRGALHHHGRLDGLRPGRQGLPRPPINVLEVNTAAPPTVKPEETWNYQIGTAFHQGPWVLGLDAYYIDFSNFITSPPGGERDHHLRQRRRRGL